MSLDLKTSKIKQLIRMMKAKKYIIYDEPYQLNIVAIRNKETSPTEFDDNLYVFWNDDNLKWEGYEYTFTTDPSTYYFNHPIGSYKGIGATAVLPSGQYIDAWKIGSHKGQYTALVQAKELCIYRDYDRNAYLDLNDEDIVCGNYGINIHRAKAGGADDGQGTTKEIGLYSAGCQVFANNRDFDQFLGLVKKQANIYGTKYFTYTLFDKWIKNQIMRKYLIYLGGLGTGAGFLGYGIYLWSKNK